MTRSAISEAALAARVVSMLEALDCDVYQEVTLPQSGDVADIVALRGPEVWIVETKTSWSLELLEQCVARRRHAHRVFAAVPSTRADHRHVFAELRIGAILVPMGAGAAAVDAYIMEWAPRLATKRAAYRALRERLHEKHKTSAQAGTNHGDRYTPYRQTCDALLALVQRQPGVQLTEAIRRITHHYASMQSARGSLAKWVEEGKVPGVQSRVEDGKLRLFPGCARCDKGEVVRDGVHVEVLKVGAKTYDVRRACSAVSA